MLSKHKLLQFYHGNNYKIYDTSGLDPIVVKSLMWHYSSELLPYLLYNRQWLTWYGIKLHQPKFFCEVVEGDGSKVRGVYAGLS